jgi:hypothetical protein
VKHDTTAKWENLLASVPVLNYYVLLTGFNDEKSQLWYVTLSAKEGQSIGTSNWLMFHTNSTIDFSFAGISNTIADVSVAMSVTFWDEMTGHR